MEYEVLARNIAYNEFVDIVKAFSKKGYKSGPNSMYIRNGGKRSLISFIREMGKETEKALLVDITHPNIKEAKDIFYETLASSRGFI